MKSIKSLPKARDASASRAPAFVVYCSRFTHTVFSGVLVDGHGEVEEFRRNHGNHEGDERTTVGNQQLKNFAVPSVHAVKK